MKTTDTVDLAMYTRIGTAPYDQGQAVSRVWWMSYEDEAAVLVMTSPGEAPMGVLYHIDTDDLPADGYTLHPEELAQIAYGPRPCQVRNDR
jgi:hypothetical protein